MEAPEKIYVHVRANKELGTTWHGTWIGVHDIEYIRTDAFIENEHRQPTFDDAIKYGMRLQKEQMMANSADAMIGLPYENKDGGYTHLVDVSRPLPVGDNKIAIIFKED